MPDYALSFRPRNSLLLRFPQLDKLLIDKDIIKLRARGYCMYPSILPGDILRARHRELSEINSGEVVVFSRGGVIFAHRVIRKCEEAGNLSLVTQADSIPLEDGALVYGSNILGVLVSLERKGREVDFNKKKLRPLLRLYLNALLLLEKIKVRIRPFLSEALRFISYQKVYCFFSQIFFPLPRNRIRFIFSIPFQLGEIGEFFKIVTFSELFTYCTDLANSRSFYFKVTLKDRDSFVASAVFSQGLNMNEYSCRLCALDLRMRYSAALVIPLLTEEVDKALRNRECARHFLCELAEELMPYKKFFSKIRPY